MKKLIFNIIKFFKGKERKNSEDIKFFLSRSLVGYGAGNDYRPARKINFLKLKMKES